VTDIQRPVGPRASRVMGYTGSTETCELAGCPYAAVFGTKRCVPHAESAASGLSAAQILRDSYLGAYLAAPTPEPERQPAPLPPVLPSGNHGCALASTEPDADPSAALTGRRLLGLLLADIRTVFTKGAGR
jgi:hypothetical protein